MTNPDHDNAMPDAQRVMGQIERGEVRADADAAREIAAQHEEAYGDVWTAKDD